MIRFFASFFIFLCLIVVEFSFLHALPAPFFFIPLIFACALYLFQHLGSESGLWWLLALGFFLDFWRVGLIFGESVAYAMTIVFAIFLGRRFFTNRSLYGVIGNAVFSLWFLHVIHAFWLFLKNFRGDYLSFQPWPFFLFVFWQTVWLVVLVSILFFLSRKIRFVLSRTFLISGRENL